MKSAVFTLLLLMSVVCSAQNYQCLHNDTALSFFLNNTNRLRAIRVDSVTIAGGDTIYHNRSGHLLSHKVIQQPDGTFLFLTDPAYYLFPSDTVVIKPQALLGDSWIFYNDTGSKFYKATITSIDTMTVFGDMDSVKRITINAYKPALDTTDNLNNATIILSKNHGFIQLIELGSFPYVYVSYSANSFMRIPFHIPTMIEAADLHAGDVLEYHTEGGPYSIDIHSIPNIDHYQYDSVLTRIDIDSAHVLLAVFEKHYYDDYYYYDPGHYTTDVYPHDTIVLGNTPAFDFNDMPEEWPYFMNYSYNPADTSWCITAPLVSKVLVPFEGCGYFKYCKIGLGILDSTYCMGAILPDGEGVSDNFDVNLIYCRKNGIVCGDGVNIRPLSVEGQARKDNNFTLLPNPVNNLLTITATSNSPYTITLTNALGQTAKTVHTNEPKITIDVSNLPSGLYYASVITQDGTAVTSKLVVMH